MQMQQLFSIFYYYKIWNIFWTDLNFKQMKNIDKVSIAFVYTFYLINFINVGFFLLLTSKMYKDEKQLDKCI